MSHFMWRKVENFIHLLDSYLLPGRKKEDWKWLIWKIGSLENSTGLVFNLPVCTGSPPPGCSTAPEALTPRCRSSPLRSKDRMGNVMLKLIDNSFRNFDAMVYWIWKYIAQIFCVVVFVFCFLLLPHMSLYLVVTYEKKSVLDIGLFLLFGCFEESYCQHSYTYLCVPLCGRIAGLYGRHIVSVSRYGQFSKWFYHFLMPPAICELSNCFLIFPDTWCCH